MNRSPNRDIRDGVVAGVLIVLSGPCWVGAGFVAADGMIFATFAWLFLAFVFTGAAIFVLREP